MKTSKAMYQKIAVALKEEFESCNGNEVACLTVLSVGLKLGIMFKTSNERFDEKKFYEVCGFI